MANEHVSDNTPAINPIAGKTIDYSNFHTEKAKKTQRLVDYYEGDQQAYLIKMLDGALNGWGKRKEWKHRGIIPRVRNIVKSIIEKSGLLFNKPPQLGIVTNPDTPPVNDPTFQEILENADFMEVMQNIDIYTRLTGSSIVLQQLILPDNVTTQNGMYKYNSTRGDQLMLTILHHGNTVVRMNPGRTKITELAYIMGDTSLNLEEDYSGRPKIWEYCVWTPEEVLVIKVNEDKQAIKDVNQHEVEQVMAREPNPYGVVPASFFYDTRKPRKGHFARPAEDLISLQEIVNLALTDTEFAIAFQKQKTLFITGDIMNDDNNSGDQLIPAAQLGNTPAGAVYNDIPFYQTRKQSYLGGLGTIAKLGQDGAGAAGKAEFIGPDTDLQKLDAIVNDLVVTIANDWSVNLNYGGAGHAGSGFQLIVEELANLNLREMRAQMMQASLRRFYEISKIIFPGQLTDGYLQCEFAPPSLPVNQAEQEDIWTKRISNNRASIKDYFCEEKGMTEEEAVAKMEEVAKYNAMLAPVPAAPPTPVTIPPAKPGSGVSDVVK